MSFWGSKPKPPKIPILILLSFLGEKIGLMDKRVDLISCKLKKHTSRGCEQGHEPPQALSELQLDNTAMLSALEG